MLDSTTRQLRDTRNPLTHYLGIGLLMALVLLLAWLQFSWLTELREEEQARRRVALRVAATNYVEHVNQEINLLLERVEAAGSIEAVAASDPMFAVLIALGGDGTGQISTSGGHTWLPATRAQLHQRLGRELVNWLTAGWQVRGALLWLDPPAIVYCSNGCTAGVLDPGRLTTAVLAPAAGRMFADFGDELRSAVIVETSGTATVLYPPEARPADFTIIDLERALLGQVRTLGPPSSHWLLKVNHGGSSLESAVARSHVRNLLLSGGLLSLLALSIGLVIYNARRQVSLAREHLYFAAGVSHDLRTPLSVISSAADNLADRTVGEDARVHDYGVLIQREVRRLKGMIENVLQFAQSASTARPRVRARIDVKALLDEVLESCAGLLGGRELQLEIADELPTVRGDPAALRSSLINLVTNAVQHASGGNWIRISAAAVRVRPRGRALRISISNPVSGRPDAHPKKLFEPFYRGQQARAAGIPGTGIGLAVARNVAEQHGGGVSIDTEQTGTVRVTVLLPVHEHPAAAHPAG